MGMITKYSPGQQVEAQFRGKWLPATVETPLPGRRYQVRFLEEHGYQYVGEADIRLPEAEVGK
jgi:hypothetical protein